MSSTTPTPPPLSSLPDTLPIFPLYGSLLLPRARLPLNIYETAYLGLIEDALGAGRMIGIVQPKIDMETPETPLYHIGCMGRIASFSETDDGRFLISLYGMCRFEIKDEQPAHHGYRRITPDWSAFADDLVAPEDGVCPFDRPRLMTALHGFFKAQGLAADWTAVQTAGTEELIAMLAMICPLAPSEKQALLEARDLTTRAELLTSLLEMAGMGHEHDDIPRH